MGYTHHDKVSGVTGLAVGAKGSEIVVADSTGLLYNAGTALTTSSAIADYTITWSSNEPTAGSAATISDGDLVAGTEIGQAIADLTAKLNVALAALRTAGLIAT